MLTERVCEPAESGNRRRRRSEENQCAGDAHEHLERIADKGGNLLADLGGDADERRTQPVAPEERAVSRREGGKPDHGDGHVENDHEPDRAEEAAGQVAARTPRFLSEVRHGLKAGVREHRERDRKCDRVPAGRHPELRSGCQRVG